MILKKAVILGSGYYGEVFLTYLSEQGYETIGFYDDDTSKIGKTIHGVQILGTFEDLMKVVQTDPSLHIFCSIGHNETRVKYLEKLHNAGAKIPNLIHESVILNDSVKIGRGISLMPGVIVMPHSIIEDYVIISIGSKVAHHTKLKKGCFLSMGVAIGANITMEDRSFVGVGASVMTGVKSIGEDALVGAGAVVIRDVEKNHIVAGVPAKTIRVKSDDV
ncbi:NeuD/PglB/VioB family sugar acetyltransferase [Flagellimonas eckloniae]|uniref:PglD N-terminal domain-containing protein n=1 Tax=Flagellimonas eckloniae TaxID=346185 RepID=A0A0N8WFQ4_9FLAO|nr:NeuD/PglB/VioB family sugar acetyltransferase [Allomuricauda eckloniae]KQC29347.1 hypothetical protein AAY42_05080 [Allomuricauda eckloniae]